MLLDDCRILNAENSSGNPGEPNDDEHVEELCESD